MAHESDQTVAYAKRVVREMNKARNFPTGTCPASRHSAMMAEALTFNGSYAMLTEEPRHCAASIAATVKALWQARSLLSRAHDAMTRRDPDGISTEAWDALVSEIGETLGVGNG